MYKYLIENYIKNMTIDNLRDYINKNYQNVSDSEIEIIYKYIKTRWKEVYDEEENVLNELRQEISESTYKEIIKLLDMAYRYKNK